MYYNKFISQPIKLLEYAKILKSEKIKKINYFKINKINILEFISIKDKNAYNFLLLYLRKVLSDSGFIRHIDRFINKTTQENFIFLKEQYQKFIIGNTPINTKTEVNRIFPKVLNIFSVEKRVDGSIKGHLSKRKIYYSDLMYNRTNFRDLKKEKSISRQEAKILKDERRPYEEYNDYLIKKAINFIKKKYKKSEVKDAFSGGPAIYVHHIFPKNEFREIADYLENLIKLTSEQHCAHAHPQGNTQIINKDYQLICLLSKSESIERSLIKGEFCYSKNSYIFVINTGLKLNIKKRLSEKLSFDEIRKELILIYKAL